MTADELIEQGVQHSENGQFAAAVEVYLRAFELSPKDERLPWEAARLYLYMLSDPEKAVRWFEASLPLIQNPFKACDTRYHLGLAHTFLKDDTKAAARFEEVLAHTPTHVLACIELGKLMTRKGDFERAKDLLQQAVLHNNMRSTLPEMFPDGQRGSAHAAALAWMNLGRLGYVASDDEALGNTAAERLIEDLGDDQRVLMLAKEAHEAGKPYSALAVLDVFLSYHPDHEEAVQQWVRISLDELGQFDDVVDLVLQLGENDTKWAERLIDEVLRRKPDHAGALEYRRVKTKH
ncbi:hypothetical protein AKJ09_04959 [Labilithrix luteola]|uniref:Uncharacterized protein n=1 Tax=Labilithrix luteola TaxID=1391654 RepID=A0A0K1PXP4_9BACT|nr:tetratricopeptide repeat protein [Labilithrix luteola]AKU98295.1 hypothetical protein AKJ09_04959 [Labilithrix luteola]